MGARARSRLRRSPVRRQSRRWQAAAGVLAGLLVLACVPGAAAEPGETTATAAAPGDPVTNADGCSDTTGVPYATGLPPLPCLKNPFDGTTLFNDAGAPFDPITQTVTRSKVSFQFDKTVMRVFYTLCSSNYPPAYPACPYETNFPPVDTSVAAGYYGVFADVYVQGPKGADPQYGAFAPVKVTTMAFGSIPVTADVTVRQQYNSDGTVKPFTLGWLQSATPIKAGKEVPGYEEYGPAPGGKFFGPPADISGPVDIEISNVQVDQVPVDVGPTCRTSTTLRLTSPGGFYESGKPVKGQPGAYQPLFNGKSFLTGSVDVPAFTGCVANGQDYSPLLTGMVSGQGGEDPVSGEIRNRVDVTQVSILTPFGCLADDSPGCETKHPATTYGP